MSLDSDIKSIRRVGGSVTINGYPIGSADEFKATFASLELNWDLHKFAAQNIRSLADVVKTNEKLPAMAKPKGYPRGYRPHLDIRTDATQPFSIQWL